MEEKCIERYRVELVWNREFNWVTFGKLHIDLQSAKNAAISIRDSGDGARVKKVRVIDNKTDKVIWNG